LQAGGGRVAARNDERRGRRRRGFERGELDPPSRKFGGPPLPGRRTQLDCRALPTGNELEADDGLARPDAGLPARAARILEDLQEGHLERAVGRGCRLTGQEPQRFRCGFRRGRHARDGIRRGDWSCRGFLREGTAAGDGKRNRDSERPAP
jgi:hypothetical protein